MRCSACAGPQRGEAQLILYTAFRLEKVLSTLHQERERWHACWLWQTPLLAKAWVSHMAAGALLQSHAERLRKLSRQPGHPHLTAGNEWGVLCRP